MCEEVGGRGREGGGMREKKLMRSTLTSEGGCVFSVIGEVEKKGKKN